MDQTPLPFEYLTGQTYNPVGERTVQIKGSKQNGVPHVQPLIFFHGQGIGATVLLEMKEYDSQVVVKYNTTAYANSQNMIQWLDEQLVPVLNNEPTLLALVLFEGHKTDDVLDTFLAHDITVSTIPSGCTGLVQPLDVSINQPFKDILRDILDEKLEKMENDEAAVLASGKQLCHSQVGRRRIVTTWAIGEAWEQFSTEKQQVVIRSFRAVGLSLPIDASCDTEISIEGLDTAILAEKLKNWHIGGLDTPVGGHNTDEDLIVLSKKDDGGGTVDFEAGPPRHVDSE